MVNFCTYYYPKPKNQFETAKVYLLNYVASLTHKHLLSLSFSAFLQENDGTGARMSKILLGTSLIGKRTMSPSPIWIGLIYLPELGKV